MGNTPPSNEKIDAEDVGEIDQTTGGFHVMELHLPSGGSALGVVLFAAAIAGLLFCWIRSKRKAKAKREEKSHERKIELVNLEQLGKDPSRCLPSAPPPPSATPAAGLYPNLPHISFAHHLGVDPVFQATPAFNPAFGATGFSDRFNQPQLGFRPPRFDDYDNHRTYHPRHRPRYAPDIPDSRIVDVTDLHDEIGSAPAHYRPRTNGRCTPIPVRRATPAVTFSAPEHAAEQEPAALSGDADQVHAASRTRAATERILDSAAAAAASVTRPCLKRSSEL